MENQNQGVQRLSHSDALHQIGNEALEVPTMQKIAGTLSEEEIEDAEALVAQMDQPAKSADLSGFLRLDRDFHVYLTGLAGNARLTKLVADLRDAQRMPGLRRLAERGELTKRNVEHREVLKAIQAGDAERVGELMSVHLSLSQEAFAVD